MKPPRTILLVDDSDSERSTLAIVLRSKHYNVRACSSLVEALNSFRVSGVDAVLLLADPGPVAPEERFKSGVDLAEEMKRLRPEVPVILFSRKQRGGYECRHAADLFLGKHTLPETLLEHLKHLLIRKRGPKKAADVFIQKESA